MLSDTTYIILLGRIWLPSGASWCHKWPRGRLAAVSQSLMRWECQAWLTCREGIKRSPWVQVSLQMMAIWLFEPFPKVLGGLGCRGKSTFVSFSGLGKCQRGSKSTWLES